jgi:hypothetical protein
MDPNALPPGGGGIFPETPTKGGGSPPLVNYSGSTAGFGDTPRSRGSASSRAPKDFRAGSPSFSTELRESTPCPTSPRGRDVPPPTNAESAHPDDISFPDLGPRTHDWPTMNIMTHEVLCNTQVIVKYLQSLPAAAANMFAKGSYFAKCAPRKRHCNWGKWQTLQCTLHKNTLQCGQSSKLCNV